MQPAWGAAVQLWEREYWNRSNDFICDLVVGYPLPNQPLFTMDNKTIVSWNVRGAAKKGIHRAVRDLVDRFNPDVMILTETRIPKNRAHDYLNKLPFDRWFATDTQDFRGGIGVAWNSASIQLHIISVTVQEVHVMVRSPNLSDFCLFTVVYASPRFEFRKTLWNNLGTIADSHDLPWIVIGEFNELLSNSEKKGWASYFAK